MALDESMSNIDPDPSSFVKFMEAVQKWSRKFILQGCGTSYVQDLTCETDDLLNKYFTRFECNPFSEDTISIGQQIVSAVTEYKRERWIKLMEEIDTSCSSQKEWRLLNHLNNDVTKQSLYDKISANQMAH